MFRSFRFCLLGTALALLCACQNYDFTINDKLVYTPKTLFSDYSTADPALGECLKQAIIDNKVTSASQLQVLNCSHAGVTNLAGLETFTGLTRLRLSSNKLRDISQLGSLSALEVLLVDDNQLIDVETLQQLPALVELHLENNAGLLCPQAASFVTLELLQLPDHCPQ